MGNYHSQKCTRQEAIDFKKEVLDWLYENNFVYLKIKVFTCYNGDVRIYTGNKLECTNQRESFRRTEPNKNEKGEIIGWNGLRGKHTTEYPEYVSINRDEWGKIKNVFSEKKGDDYDFYKDYLFDKLEKLETLT